MGGFDSAPQTESTKFSMVGDHPPQLGDYGRKRLSLEIWVDEIFYGRDHRSPTPPPGDYDRKRL